MSDNKCPKCREFYIKTSTDFKKICRCENPVRYDFLKRALYSAFKEEDKKKE